MVKIIRIMIAVYRFSK